MYKQEYIWRLGFNTVSLVISSVSLDKLLSFFVSPVSAKYSGWIKCSQIIIQY